MANINLLPWRKEYRAEKRKEFGVLVGFTAIGAVLLAYLWVVYNDTLLENQVFRNNHVKKEIAVMDARVKEIKELKKNIAIMKERMAIIQGLQSNRPEVVKVFDEFARVMPDGVFITSFKRTADNFAIDGLAESNNRIATFMRSIDDSYQFIDPNLLKVEKNSNGVLNKFNITMKIERKTDDGQADTGGEG